MTRFRGHKKLPILLFPFVLVVLAMAASLGRATLTHLIAQMADVRPPALVAEEKF